MNSNPSLIYLGNWKGSETAAGGVLISYSPVQLGINQIFGLVLSGTASAAMQNLSLQKISIAILDQNLDGTLKFNTSAYIQDPLINGSSTPVVGDLNGDGFDDIFLPATNESPPISTASTVYMSTRDGSLKKIIVNDAVQSSSAILGTIDGVKTIVSSGYGENEPYYQYDSSTGGLSVKLWGNTYAGKLYGSSALVEDFDGDGKAELVIGDFKTGPGYPYNSNNPMKLAIYKISNGSLDNNPSLIAPLYFDQPKYQNIGLISEYGPALTHNYKVWAEDFNHDGKLDLMLGGGVWSSKEGWQKSKLQLLQNQGNLDFVDVTDVLGQVYEEKSSYVDYQMQLIDLDRSGINSYLLAGDPYSIASKQSNYLILNDGTGKLYAALHSDFEGWGGSIANSFIPYKLADGSVNYLATNGWGDFYNFPLQYNITTDFTQNITITDRNQSMHMRTWAGNDVFNDAGANIAATHLDGGLGFNKSAYSDKISNYVINSLGSNGFEVKYIVGNIAPYVNDTLVNIQRLQFSDISVALDVGPAQNAGSVYMLYKAAFNRAPDTDGMGYWIAEKDGGANIVTTIAQGFVNSPEFIAKYGANSSNSSYVNNLYLNVLGRVGEAEGVAYWNAEMNAGRVSKAQALVYFATLPEGAGIVAPLIANGIQYQEWVG